MATLRELTKRLKSTRTVLELSGAMRSVAAAKLARAGAMREAYSPYAAGLKEAAALAGSPALCAERGERKLFVLLSGNRGLCGGYNHELFDFFEAEVLRKETAPLIVTCGEKAAEYCRDKGVETLAHVRVPDVPAFKDAVSFSEKVLAAYEETGAASVSIVYRRFVNMLKQPCEIRGYLPAGSEEGEAGEVIFIPDRETAAKELYGLALASDAYDALLSCASGAQAASVMAMRSAFDNAKASRSKLELEDNRLRQAGVTASVLETAAGGKE